MAKNTQPTGQPPVVEQIDNSAFNFSFAVITSNNQILQVRKGAIRQLIIEEDILNWWHQGYAIIDNPYDALERSSQIGKDDPDYAEWSTKQAQDIENLFSFKNNGGNYIYLTVEPSKEEDVLKSTGLNSPHYSMNFLFAITKREPYTEPGQEDNPENKALKITFVDYRKAYLDSRSAYWSTALAIKHFIPTSKPVAHMTDSEKELLTGLEMRLFLKLALDPITDEVTFSDNWDPGCERTFYTSKSNENLSDVLDGFVDRHISSDGAYNSPCLLRLDRYTQEFSLQPLTTIFDKAYNKASKTPGIYQTEKFFVSEPDNATSSQQINDEIKTRKSIQGNSSPTSNYFFPEYSVIGNYMFIEMQSDFNEKYLTTAIAHSYDFTQQNFTTYLEDSSYQSIKDYYKKHFVDTMYGDERTGPQVPWDEDIDKDENKIVNHVFFTQDNSVDTDNVKNSMRNQVIMGALFSGNTLQFTAKGLTTRRVGRFITLDRMNFTKETDYDNKLMGQHLVTRVVHDISSAGYANHITTIKTYNFGKPKTTKKKC